MAKILNIGLIRIEIYPYGGLSKLDYKINIELYKELLILIFGPLTQILFTYLIYYLNIDINNLFYSYSKLILIFNLLPIYPLDGGKILNILLSYILSFYNSLKYTYYISHFNTCILVMIAFLYNKNLLVYIIIVSLIMELLKEKRNINIIFNKYLLERYLYSYNFKKYKIIYNIYSMKRDYYHFFIYKNIMLNEKDYLKNLKNML